MKQFNFNHNKMVMETWWCRDGDRRGEGAPSASTDIYIEPFFSICLISATLRGPPKSKSIRHLSKKPVSLAPSSFSLWLPSSFDYISRERRRRRTRNQPAEDGYTKHLVIIPFCNRLGSQQIFFSQKYQSKNLQET